MKVNTTKKFSALLISVFFFYTNVYSANIEFKSTIIKSPLPGLNISTGFFTLSSDQDLLIKLIESDIIGKIEIHSMEMKKTSDGLEIMQMREIKLPKIINGVPFVLKPGGNHLMLYEINPKILSATNLILKFTFETNSGNLLTKDVVFTIN